jgi:drug/metabolite transporter (DMT)-like permease
MRSIPFAFGLLVLIIFDTAGQLGFKLAGDAAAPAVPFDQFLVRLLQGPWILLVIAAYAFAFLTYMTLLKIIPMGPLFAASHLEIVVVTIISIYLFNEHLSAVQVVGCGLIVAGFIWLTRSLARDGKPSLLSE